LTTDGGGGSAGACNMPSVAGAGAAAAKPVAAAALRLLLLLPPPLQAASSCRSVRECSAWLRSQINCPASSRECVASSQTTTTATHHAVSRPALAHFSFVSIAISFTPFLPPPCISLIRRVISPIGYQQIMCPLKMKLSSFKRYALVVAYY